MCLRVSMCVRLCHNLTKKNPKLENSFRGTIMVQKRTNYLQIKLNKQKEESQLKCRFMTF